MCVASCVTEPLCPCSTCTCAQPPSASAPEPLSRRQRRRVWSQEAERRVRRVVASLPGTQRTQLTRAAWPRSAVSAQQAAGTLTTTSGPHP